ncbi:hypothetical protein ACQPVP_00335 [Clostridium nigeriense]|uniref:hypothetical protein n=1 Tax=Clostridium nigeriense TaxID=1805470 RepID=UPI003D347683
MLNKKLLLTLGAGYICTHISNVKKIKIDEDLKCYNDKNRDLSIFILNNGIYENLIILNFDKKNNQIKIGNFQNEKERLSKIYNEHKEIEIIKSLNLENNLSINNLIKFDYIILKEYVDKINGINLKITKREAKLLKLEINEGNTYKFNGEKLIEYLSLDYIGADKVKRLKKVFKILLNNILNLSKKEFLNTISEIMSNIETSLSTKELVSLGLYTLKLNSSNIEEYNFDIREKVLM